MKSEYLIKCHSYSFLSRARTEHSVTFEIPLDLALDILFWKVCRPLSMLEIQLYITTLAKDETSKANHNVNPFNNRAQVGECSFSTVKTLMWVLSFEGAFCLHQFFWGRAGWGQKKQPRPIGSRFPVFPGKTVYLKQQLSNLWIFLIAVIMISHVTCIYKLIHFFSLEI